MERAPPTVATVVAATTGRRAMEETSLERFNIIIDVSFVECGPAKCFMIIDGGCRK